ncbi:excalibur calcium-binding domain-containing protein [Streptomyces sp. NBC_01669]
MAPTPPSAVCTASAPGYGPHLDRDGDGIGCDWG